ncbi:hypothetical protein AB0F20_05965 [Streptomyces goshikiensis]|uniref:hypothetical protein n=1 Tax=Streptomyces goshikiensis TaxID=1942 RepID=UPI0033D0274D
MTASLDALQGGPVDAGFLSQSLLGHVCLNAGHADVVADSSSGIADPFRLFGWHPATLSRS